MNHDMNHNHPGQLDPGPLDRILAHEDALVPSSGFAASVMETIQDQAAAPAPIPFPWKLALPGIAALIVALVIIARLTASAIQNTGSGGAGFLSQSRFTLMLAPLVRAQAGPALLALAVALVCTLLCRRLGVRSTR